MIAIIKYNAGNTQSLQNALNLLGYDSVITDKRRVMQVADKVIFPGVGRAGTAMQYLKSRGIDEFIKASTQPFLGICLGLQLMCNATQEDNTECLGIFNTSVKRFSPKDKVPHMGWNNFEHVKGALFDNVQDIENMYYVHSYYAQLCNDTVAKCNYIESFSAAFQKDNFYATQFHPEKSGVAGQRVLKNFLEL